MITKSIKQFFIAGSVCCGVAVALTSCADMLETDSELVEYEKDNTLNHPTDSVYSVMGIINKMQVIADRSVLLGEVRGDLVSTTEAASADLKRLANFDFTQDNKYNQVSDYYAVINNCNYYLAHIDTTLQRRGRILFQREYAAVKAFRAWTYLELVKAYGSVPLVTTPMMTEREANDALNITPSNIKQVCQYFIDDLKPLVEVEVPDFGTIGDYKSVDFFLPIKALLGDLYLWSEQYNDAAYNCDLFQVTDNDRTKDLTAKHKCQSHFKTMAKMNTGLWILSYVAEQPMDTGNDDYANSDTFEQQNRKICDISQYMFKNFHDL